MKAKTRSRMVGYARVSTGQQDLQLQLDALDKAGVSRKLVFTDKVSGAKTSRPGLDACLQQLQSGDTLLVWRLDRLGRSLRHLVDLIEDLRQRGIGFRSLCDGGIDTTTASGELIFNVFASLAQFERRLIMERTRAGLTSARARQGHALGPEDAGRGDLYDAADLAAYAVPIPVAGLILDG